MRGETRQPWPEVVGARAEAEAEVKVEVEREPEHEPERGPGRRPGRGPEQGSRPSSSRRGAPGLSTAGTNGTGGASGTGGTVGPGETSGKGVTDAMDATDTRAANARPLLEVTGLTMRFGNLAANDNVTFNVHRGEIVALIGPNGAGKTTCFNCVSGFLRPTAGRVVFDGIDITGMRPYHICRLGLTRTFQIVKTLGDMTVEENVMTGAFLRAPGKREAREVAAEVLELTGLLDKRAKPGRSLTIAERKRLEIARALATRPKLLMLDEAMAGLNPTEIKGAMDLCLRLREAGLTLVVVEHIMEAIMPISDRVIVLSSGEKIAEGTPEEVAANEDVIKAYLGEKYHAAS